MSHFKRNRAIFQVIKKKLVLKLSLLIKVFFIFPPNVVFSDVKIKVMKIKALGLYDNCLTFLFKKQSFFTNMICLYVI